MHQTQFSEKIPYGGFSQIRSHMAILMPFLHCMALLCIQLDCVVVFGPFFFLLSVWSPCYTLSRKKKILIIGTLGSGWDRKFYMGTQNGSNYKL